MAYQAPHSEIKRGKPNDPYECTQPLAVTFRYSGRRIGHPRHLCGWGSAGAWMRTSDNPSSHRIITLPMRNKREPTSGLEALSCSLRVIGQALQRCAGGCKCLIFRGVSFPCLAQCCTVLRSRWYQSGIRTSDNYRLTAGPVACSRSFYRSIPTASLSFPRPPTAYAGTNASNIVNAHTRRTTSFTLRHGNISVPADRGQPLS